MVQVDWDRIRAVKAVTLTDNEIDDLFPMVIRCEIEEVDDIYNLRALMKLSQEMLQYKDNQVESLLLECDELKDKLSKLKTMNNAGTIDKDNNDSRMINSYPADENYMDSLQLQKNDKIKNLMLELEGLEKENIVLKEKLDNLKEETEDATENMNEMTDELNNLRGKNIIFKDEVDLLKQEKIALLNQIKELTVQQLDRDKIIDEFGAAIDIRVSEWKNILEYKDNEIILLKNELSKIQLHPTVSMTHENTSQIIYLNNEIDKRDNIILELESKLLDAANEITNGAKLIEKLKIEIKQMEKSGRRKEQRDLLKKIQESNEKISHLQLSLNETEENLTAKSKQLCEVLGDLKRYENKDHGLSDTINELKELKKQLLSKNNHIQDIINVINKLEALNSHQQLQIIALREKLGLSEDDEISIEEVASRHQKEAQIKNELIKQNKLLEQENFNLKSDIRILNFKLNKLNDSGIITHDTINEYKPSTSTNITTVDLAEEQEIISSRYENNMTEIQENIRVVIEENEALRKGMHEIMDSIRDQDEKSVVEIQSDTLERLLQALDVRHVAGWYHPAMRLQERLNVVQGSNAELRNQLKQLRKEIQEKDSLLHRSCVKSEVKNPNHKLDDSDDEEIIMYVDELQQIQAAYEDKLNKWNKDRELLNEENNNLKEINENLTGKLEIFDADLKAIEDGDDEIGIALAKRTKECGEMAMNLTIAKRKCKIMEELLTKETIKIYNIQKDTFANESTYKKLVADMKKQNDLLENDVKTLKNNLLNSVTKLEFNALKEKYNKINLRLRIFYEFHIISNNNIENEILNDELDMSDDKIDDESLGEINKEIKLLNENDYDKIVKINSDLQEQLLKLQNLLMEKLQLTEDKLQDNNIIEMKNEINKLRIENENLLKSLTISRDEAQMYYTINSLKILEVDNLRHQIVDLQAVSEDKETIARLGFELNSCKTAEMEMNRNKIELENEILQLRNNLNISNDKCNKVKIQLDNYHHYCDNKYRNYENIIDYLIKQYSGFTSLSSLMRYEIMLKYLTNDRKKIDLQLNEAKDNNEKAKIQQETLTNRLEIVDRLKDILEQQIGSSDLDNLMQHFSENSQSTLNEYRFKRKISQLESELKTTTDKLNQYESMIVTMEYDMINIQNIWRNKIEKSPIIIENNHNQNEINSVCLNKKSVYVEAHVECHSVQVQCNICETSITPQVSLNNCQSIKLEKAESLNQNDIKLNDTTVSSLQDQLNEALSMASERSAILIKYESQIAEFEAKIIALNNIIIEKDVKLMEQNELLVKQKLLEDNNVNDIDDNDNISFKSSLNSLQKIINQKEETITRYQLLLKEDRDEHSKAAARLQEEIKNVRDEMSIIKKEAELIKSKKLINYISECDKLTVKMPNDVKKDRKIDVEMEEKIVRLNEQVSTLEADLNIVYELSERWRRLADERLNHIDEMREKLENQHKIELDSYRLELDKWQSETAALRQQLSENRMKLSKINISLSKELQERDNKIDELTMLNQQLQSEIEMFESMGQSQPQVTDNNLCVTKIQEINHNYNRHDLSVNAQSEIDYLRRQHKSIIEKEKLYKEQIADLRQQLSRRYMAEKIEEKRVSQREGQLERKLKNIEDELNKARIQLDREYKNHEAKRIKTAEELSLWDKQKKWQQIADKLKKELKDKSDECKKLNINYDKLKGILSCMEREKWYLRSKIRSDNANIVSGQSDINIKIIDDLQNECEILRNRVSELTDRLQTNDNQQLLIQIEQQKRRIVALEAVTEGNTFVVDELEKLESVKCILEKANIKLESENFELRMEIEKQHMDTPRLKEKVEHLEKYIELLKVEKSSESLDKDHEEGSKKSVLELEKTIFVLKRIVEKLQVENKRLKINLKNNHRHIKSTTNTVSNGGINDVNLNLKKQYEETKKRVIALETDLQLAEQRIEMLIAARKDDDNADEIEILKQQLAHKSELLDKVKQLLTRAAINEKALRQRIQQIELKQTLSTIPECLVPSSINN